MTKQYNMRTNKCETLQINNININYCSYGDSNNITVIFIHGYPLDQTMWKTQVAFLIEEFHVITYDIRGFGKTESGNEAYSLPLFADDLFQLMYALKIEKAILCGFSMGGYIALNACITKPELFNGLILHDTQCHADTAEGREQRMQSVDFINRNGVKAYAGPFIKKMVAARSLSDSGIMNYLEEKITSHSPDQLSAILKMLADRKETCSALHQIAIPVLIIRGAEDAIISEEKADFMKSNIKHSKSITIQEAGHLSNMEQPVQFNIALKDFLKSMQ